MVEKFNEWQLFPMCLIVDRINKRERRCNERIKKKKKRKEDTRRTKEEENFLFCEKKRNVGRRNKMKREIKAN